MWSVVEKTALAEAEVEYEDYTSDTVWVKFPVRNFARHGSKACGSNLTGKRVGRYLDNDALDDPGNRAVSFSPKIKYALYEVTDAPQIIGRNPATFVLVRKSCRRCDSNRRA